MKREVNKKDSKLLLFTTKTKKNINKKGKKRWKKNSILKNMVLYENQNDWLINVKDFK